MASLVLRRDLSLEVPKLLVGTVQPYQTLAGPALTTSFLHQPELLPFQSTPFYHAAVAPLYFHTLLHTLAEFAETPRAVRHSHVKQQHAPKADFWDAVGTLNCFYFTANYTSAPPPPATAAAASSSVLRGRVKHGQHPAMGAVELVRPSHRKESDVKLTLFNNDHQPIASMLMTGPKEGPRVYPDDMSVVHQNAPSSASPQHIQQYRTPLPFEAPSLNPSDYVSSSPGGEGGSSPCEIVIGGTQVHGGLYGEVVSMGDGAGYAHRAVYWTDDLTPSSTKVPTASSTMLVTEEVELKEMNGEECLRNGKRAAAERTVMPPWLLYDCVQRFFFCLHKGGHFGTDPAIIATDGWRLSSHHVVQVADAVMGVPLEVVCAPPRVNARYRLPPWRSQLGLPIISGGAVPCVSLRCEVRQDGQMISTGVYFFCRWAGVEEKASTAV